MSPRRLGSAMVVISALERTGGMPSSSSAVSSIIWWVRMGSWGSTESKSLQGDTIAIRVGSAGWEVPGRKGVAGTHTRSGRKRWMRAQRAKPLVQEEVKSVTATPRYPAVLAWHQLSSSS